MLSGPALRREGRTSWKKNEEELEKWEGMDRKGRGKESLREAVRAACLSDLLSLSLVKPPLRPKESRTRGRPGKTEQRLTIKTRLIKSCRQPPHVPRPLSLSPLPSLPPSLTHSFHPSSTTSRLILFISFFFFICCFLSTFWLYVSQLFPE